ncbi:hypothetical protein BCLUESOX_2487 [bacterium endosymbiont of Bathymodiolus sp. 5 South]|nr:hypothetical protein [uncultured Gammaproteobacteria bacterium]SHN92363.1 hypothetical protein BCLUESOX_2487 [bacterium endosymbiont of Bathymodiolus sp. 5 South]
MNSIDSLIGFGGRHPQVKTPCAVILQNLVYYWDYSSTKQQ